MWKVKIARRRATLISFPMELRVLCGLEIFLKISGLRVLCSQASALKWVHVSSPLLREASFHDTLQSQVPAPSALPLWAMPCSTQLHQEIFSHGVLVMLVSEPSPSSLLAGGWHLGWVLLLADRVSKEKPRFKFTINTALQCKPKKKKSHPFWQHLGLSLLFLRLPRHSFAHRQTFQDGHAEGALPHSDATPPRVSPLTRPSTGYRSCSWAMCTRVSFRKDCEEVGLS